MVVRLGEFLSKIMGVCKLLLIPISQGAHYTLLAVSKDEDQTKYYDGLTEVSQECWDAAKLFCKAIGVSMPPAKTSVSSQIGAECAICALHWAEGGAP